MRNFSAIIIIILVLSNIFYIQVADAQDKKMITPKSLTIKKATGKIVIDGELNDPGWTNAAGVNDFIENEPGINIPPLEKTEVLITYDEMRLYVGFICYDDPKKIRATMCKRDETSHDDRIGILIDTYGDASMAYEFFVNPYGVQMDKLFSQEAGEDNTYDIIWESAGKITSQGYQVELAIPFSSLRFPNQSEQTWRVEFWRNHPRDSRHMYSWNLYDNDETCWPCQWGILTGIKDVNPGKGIQVMPSAIGYQTGRVTGFNADTSNTVFDNTDPDGDLSLDAKYSITSNITVDVTINPDFSQIEADAAEVDINSTSAIFYDERRPFFQEGSDLFNTPLTSVYTRMINDPLIAGKLIGRMGRTNIAYLFAYDEHSPISIIYKEGNRFLFADESFTNIFRIRQTFGNNSRVGFLATDRRHKDGGSGTVLNFDSSFRLSKSNNLSFQFLSTHTEEPDDSMLSEQIQGYIDDGIFDSTFNEGENTYALDGESFWGYGLYSAYSYETQNLNVSLSHLETSPTYRPDIGYRSKNSQRGPRLSSTYDFWFRNNKWIQRISSYVEVGSEWNFDDEKNYEFIQANMKFVFKAQTSVHSRYERSNALYKGRWFDNLYSWHTCLSSQFSDMVRCGGDINYGNEIARYYMTVARELDFILWLDVKPIDNFLMEFSYHFVDGNALDEEIENNPSLEKNLYEDYILWSRINYQFNRELSLRLVMEYDDYYKYWGVDPLITYQLNPFTVFYAGFSHDFSEYELFDDNRVSGKKWKQDSRQFFVKIRYLLQI